MAEPTQEQKAKEVQNLGIITSPATEAELFLKVYKDFYGGEQGVVLSGRQKEYLLIDGKDPASFMNLCKMAVGVIIDRLSIKEAGTGISPFDDASQEYSDKASEWWTQGSLDALQHDLNTLIQRDGVGWLSVEWDDNSKLPVWAVLPSFNGDYNIQSVRGQLFEKSDRFVDFLAHNWVHKEYSEDGRTVTEFWRLDLWSRANGGVLLHNYQTEAGGENWQAVTEEQLKSETGQAQTNSKFLQLTDLPIIRFTTTDEVSLLIDVLIINRLMNKAVGDIDLSADGHAFPMITGEGLTRVPKDETVKYNQSTAFSGKDIRRIEGADLKLMWDGTVLGYIDILSMAKRWPLWLLNSRDFSPPAGIALRVGESGLVSQVKKEQQNSTPQWLAAFDIARQWHNLNTTPKLDGQLKIGWNDPQTSNVIEDDAIRVNTAKVAGLADSYIQQNLLGLTAEQLTDAQRRLLSDPDTIEQLSRILAQLATLGISPDGWIKLLQGEPVTAEELTEVDTRGGIGEL